MTSRSSSVTEVVCSPLWTFEATGRFGLKSARKFMAEGAHDSVRKKVNDIFRELAGDQAATLNGSKFPSVIASKIKFALSHPDAGEDQVLHADEIAFHLTDWNSDAAFIVALHLFPERFTTEEIGAAIDMFLIHVPNHVIAAARLAGHPVDDIFNDGR